MPSTHKSRRAGKFDALLKNLRSGAFPVRSDNKLSEVFAAARLLKNGKAKTEQEACRMAGISNAAFSRWTSDTQRVSTKQAKVARVKAARKPRPVAVAPDGYLTARDAAKQLGHSTQYMYQLNQRGKIAFEKIDGVVCYHYDDIAAYAEANPIVHKRRSAVLHAPEAPAVDPRQRVMFEPGVTEGDIARKRIIVALALTSRWGYTAEEAERWLRSNYDTRGLTQPSAADTCPAGSHGDDELGRRTCDLGADHGTRFEEDDEFAGRGFLAAATMVADPRTITLRSIQELRHAMDQMYNSLSVAEERLLRIPGTQGAPPTAPRFAVVIPEDDGLNGVGGSGGDDESES